MLEDLRECPGTTSLAVSWILVFALMAALEYHQRAPHAPNAMGDPRPISTATTHRFGDMTWSEVRQGDCWRLVTATFVHFGLIHIAMNLLGLIKLGPLIEPWYGPGPFLAVCLAIGGLGNLAGGLMRQGVVRIGPWVAASGLAGAWPGLVGRLPRGGPAGSVATHTGGGSTVLLGLLGLAAVVGWRSRTRIGSFLRDQMVVILGFTAVLGFLLSDQIDNYGHAGGALVGAAIGFGHRPMVRLSDRKGVRRAAWALVALVTVACIAAMARDDRIEGDLNSKRARVAERSRAAEATRGDLSRLYQVYGRGLLRSPPETEADILAVNDLLDRMTPIARASLVDPRQDARDRVELAELLGRLDSRREDLRGDTVAADLARLRALGRESAEVPPRYEQLYEFVVCWKSAVGALDADIQVSKAASIELDQLAGQAR